MTAIVIDLKDFDTRTPEQTVRTFLSLYSPDDVNEQLWEIFIRCARNNEKEGTPPDPQTTQIADLFDHLIALTKALHQLRDNTPGNCVLCGRPPVEEN